MSLQVFFYFVMPAVFIALGALATFAPVATRSKAKEETHVSQPAHESLASEAPKANVAIDEKAPDEENEYLKLFKASLAEEPKSKPPEASFKEMAWADLERSLAEEAKRILADPASGKALQEFGQAHVIPDYIDRSVWIIGSSKRDAAVAAGTPILSLADLRIENFSTRGKSADPPAREEKSAS